MRLIGRVCNMKNKIKTIMLGSLLISLFGCQNVNNSSSSSLITNSSKPVIEVVNDKWEFSSPNNKIKIKTYIVNEHFEYDVSIDGKEVVKRSELGISTSIADFSNKLNFVSYKYNENVEVNYDTITGKKSSVSTSYNEMIFTFEKYGINLDIAMRAYNDGYAYKYYINDNSGSYTQMTVGEENSEFVMPDNSKMFIQPANLERDYFSYEETYLEVRPNRINGTLISMPVLYQTKDDVYSLITEADLYGHGYIGSFLKGTKDGSLVTVPSYGASSQNLCELPFETPWRLGVVGTLDTIISSTLVEDVYGEVEYWKPIIMMI